MEHTHIPPKYQLCISPPKTQPVWFQATGEMPRKPLQQQIPNDCYRREVASLDNSLLSSQKKPKTLQLQMPLKKNDHFLPNNLSFDELLFCNTVRLVRTNPSWIAL